MKATYAYGTPPRTQIEFGSSSVAAGAPLTILSTTQTPCVVYSVTVTAGAAGDLGVGDDAGEYADFQVTAGVPVRVDFGPAGLIVNAGDYLRVLNNGAAAITVAGYVEYRKP